MAQIREIKKRIKAVRNIQRITNTMQMIATARFKASQDRAVASRPYFQKVRALTQELAQTAGTITHPLFQPAEKASPEELVLVITSNRGLCGAYNSNVLRRAMQHLRSADHPTRLEVRGKKGLGFFRFAGREISQSFAHFGDEPSYEDVQALAQRYMKEFTEGRYSKVSVVYMAFYSAGRQRPEVEQLLPLKPTAETAAEKMSSLQGSAGTSDLTNLVYDFSPDPESLLTELLPITVKTALFQAFNDAIVSEHVARMVAMKAATDNAKKLGKTLRRNYNRARQAQITTELNEIIGGAAGLD